MRRINLVCFLMPFLGICQTSKIKNKETNFLVCYGKLQPEMIKGYDLLVLESTHYTSTEIEQFKKNNKKVIAYLSISEVNKASEYFTSLKEYSVGTNSIWDSYYLDISNELLQNTIIECASKIMNKGFDGLFLDNLDNTSPWGQLSSMKGDMISMLKKVKEIHPKSELVQNGGLHVASELKKVTDLIVIESVVSKYNFEKKSYEFRDVLESNQFSEKIVTLKNTYNLNILVVEYADMRIKKDKIEQKIEALGLPVFVANIDLQTIPNFKK